MKRRQLVRSVAATVAAVPLAGCSTQSETEPLTTPNTPRVSWDHEAVESSNTDTAFIHRDFTVTATIQLNGASEVLLSSVAGGPIESVTESGTHTVAGPRTEFGPAGGEQWFSATFPDGVASEWEEKYNVALNRDDDTQPPESQARSSVPVFLDGITGRTTRLPPEQKQGESRDERIHTHYDDSRDDVFVSIPESLVEYYTSRPRNQMYGSYVSDSHDDGYLERLARKIATKPPGEERAERTELEMVIQFVRNLDYVTDQDGESMSDYPKYPVETLLDNGGDCEDTTALMAGLFEQLGYDTVLLWYVQGAHISVGLADGKTRDGTSVEYHGKEYHYVETTDTGYRIGEPYSSLGDEDPVVIDTTTPPSCSFSYSVTADRDAGVTVHATVINAGGESDATARLKAEFQARDRQTIESVETEPLEFPLREQKSISLTAEPPADRDLRVKVSVFVDDHLQDTSVSEYRTV